MSDLREAICKYLDETMLDINVDGMTDVLVDIVGSICVERERAAWLACAHWARYRRQSSEDAHAEMNRRYPLPKEE